MSIPPDVNARLNTRLNFDEGHSHGQTSSAQVWKLNPQEQWQQQTDELAVEEPLQIEIDGQPWLTTMRTPGQDQEMAIGLLLAEGIIRSRQDLADISYCQEDDNGNLLRIILAAHCQFDPAAARHVSYANSSCGICGKISIDTLQAKFPPISDKIKIDSDLIAGLPVKLQAQQSTFQRTGGLHGAALFDLDGNLQVVREDVGRHNAVDKVIGYAVLNNRLPLSRSILLVSGRIAFEIVHKALAASIPIIAAISAPTSLAVSFAEQNNQTLVGFLRGQQMNAYCHVKRLIGGG